jgi:cell division protein FtsZ
VSVALACHCSVDCANGIDQLVREAGAAAMKLVSGQRWTSGPCFGRHEIDTRRAAACRDGIVRALDDADLVLLIGGMGGHTSTAAVSFVAQLARETGALTMAVVTRPFGFEGQSRSREADAGLRDLAAVCHATVVIPGVRAMEAGGDHARLVDVLACRDEAIGGPYARSSVP